MQIDFPTSAASQTNSGTDNTIPLPTKGLSQNDFLKLLVTQMTSQDPLKPIDNQDMLSQMVQFSTLNANTTMQSALGQMQAGAMGAIAACPASETAGVLPPITGTPTTIPFVPLVTSPFAPTLPSLFGTPALTQFGTLSIPPIGTPTTPAFGTSAMSGICSPTAPAQPAPLGIPASLAPGIGAAFSDAAIPLEATEASGGVGLSPLISVPPPAISSSGCAGTPTMMGAAPLAMPSSSASGASPC